MAQVSSLKKQTSYKKGVDAEARAAAALMADGYRILNQRFRTPAGEIDLVVRRGSYLGFVEVKRRRSTAEAAWAITARQQRRIADAALYWLQANPDHGAENITFDAMLLSPGKRPEHIVDAFRL